MDQVLDIGRSAGSDVVSPTLGSWIAPVICGQNSGLPRCFFMDSKGQTIQRCPTCLLMASFEICVAQGAAAASSRSHTPVPAVHQHHHLIIILLPAPLLQQQQEEAAQIDS